MALLVDLDDACCVDESLELMAKAASEGGRAPESVMWSPLENRWGRWLVEESTRRFQAILQAMQAALGRFLGGDAGELRKADVPWLRWDEARFEIVRARLESIGPDSFTLDDWLLLILWLIQRFLPDNVINTEAEWLAVRASLMGKIQANLERDKRVTDPMIETLATLLPNTFAAVPPRILTPTELSILNYGKAHAGENIRRVTEEARHRMALICMEHVQGGLLGQKEGTWAYARTRLHDEFATLNRDFRRIAVTEGGEAVNQGYVAALPVGQFVKRQEAYRYACHFCQSINGKRFEVVAADAPNKNGQTQVWPGKTNIGRSASPRKRVGNLLVEREPHEMWWPAAGVQHPHCRGNWTRITQRPPAVSEEWFNWLNDKLAAASRAALSA